MKQFIPIYPLVTYLYYPLFIGGSFWLIKGAIGNYQKGIIDLLTMIFVVGIAIILLYWIYFFTKNKFSTIDFNERELVFTNVLGAVIRVKKEEIKSITSSGIRTKAQIMPISFYFMDNNAELYFNLEVWRR
ncbi:MAG: hypothetical protein ACO1OF_01620 [Adhaeribacter sp.]